MNIFCSRLVLLSLKRNLHLSFIIMSSSSSASDDDKIKKMESIKDIEIKPMPSSNFLKPLRFTFTQNDSPRFWDFVKIHESVSSIIFNTSRSVLIFVKQFRPAVFYNTEVIEGKPPMTLTDSDKETWKNINPKNGITLELCAGIVDKPNLSLPKIMQEEILEECGYKVPLENITILKNYRSGIGVSGDRQTLFYTEVTDEMRVNDGGGVASEGECISVVELTIPEIKEYISHDSVASPGGFLYAMLWFLQNKAT